MIAAFALLGILTGWQMIDYAPSFSSEWFGRINVVFGIVAIVFWLIDRDYEKKEGKK